MLFSKHTYFLYDPVRDEDPKKSIMLNHYVDALNKSGWRHTYIISAPLSPGRYMGKAGLAMLKKRILGTTGRNIIIAEKK